MSEEQECVACRAPLTPKESAEPNREELTALLEDTERSIGLIRGQPFTKVHAQLGRQREQLVQALQDGDAGRMKEEKP